MIITCPACTTRYNAGEAVLGKRARKVRCVKCAHKWVLDPTPETQPDAGAHPSASFAPEPMASASRIASAPAHAIGDSADSGAPPRRRGLSLDRLASFVLALMILIGIIAGAVQYRTQLVRLWPPLGGIYAKLGMVINARGLEIRKTEWRIETRNGAPLLVITGEVANIAQRTLAVPRLNLVVRDAKGHELYRWNTVIADAKSVAAGEALPFTTTLESPPLEAHDVEIRFLSEN
jgi:predicted Zn finger-like uncharacterized protein